MYKGLSFSNRFLSEERIRTLNLFNKSPSEIIVQNQFDLVIDFNELEGLENVSIEFLKGNHDSTNVQYIYQLIYQFVQGLDNCYQTKPDYILNGLYWISSDFDIKDIVGLLYSSLDYDFFLALLLITSITENSLANLYVQNCSGSSCPNMLVDLLNTDFLKEILTERMVCLLQIFIGSPRSLNLRNLSWHGFLWESNFFLLRNYAAFLLVCLWNIGYILKRSNKHRFDFSKRFKTTDLTDFHFDNDDNDLNSIHYSNFIDNFQSTSFPCLLKILQGINEKIQLKQHYFSLCLLLPTLQFYLRMAYIRANDDDLSSDELAIAVYCKYFVTEDIILREKLDNGNRNRFIDYLGKKACSLLLEIYIYPDGPRLKDIVSHGELTSKRTDLLSWEKAIGLLLCFVIDVYENRTLQNKNNTRIRQWLDSYEPRYHIFALIKNSVVSINRKIAELQRTSATTFNLELIDENFFHKASFEILFRDSATCTRSGVTVKTIVNQIYHVQERLLFGLDFAKEYVNGITPSTDYSQQRIANRNNFYSVVGRLLIFFVRTNSICGKLFDLVVIQQMDDIDMRVIKLIKRLVMSCDKICSLVKKHKWVELLSVIQQFESYLGNIDKSWGFLCDACF